MKKTKTAAAPEPNLTATTAPVLTFGDLMAHLFAAGIDFKFGQIADNPPERRYGGWVNGEVAEGADPVTVMLQALALGVRVEQAKTAKHTERLAARKQRLAKIEELIPGVTAHAPADDGNKCSCGVDHSSGGILDAVMASLGETLGLKVTKVETQLTPAKKDRAKKPTN